MDWCAVLRPQQDRIPQPRGPCVRHVLTHVAGSRSVLVLQEQMEESFPGCSHPANIANAETRQALGASLGRGVPCPSWACASCTPQEGWKEPLGTSLCSQGNQPGVSLCPQGSQLVSRTPGFKWGSVPSTWFLVAVGNSSFSGASGMVWACPSHRLHTQLSRGICHRGSQSWLDL